VTTAAWRVPNVEDLGMLGHPSNSNFDIFRALQAQGTRSTSA
jgi:hypothetical protein